jgi:DNA-binding MarR family transcriptional regulator
MERANSSHNKVESRYFVETAARVLDILESFASPYEPLSITEIARRTNLTYSSAFRLLYTLEKRGYVTRRAGRKHYLLPCDRPWIGKPHMVAGARW